jgi:hypothetical protein
MIILLCNWVVANYEGSYATVRWDEYGFTLIHFERLILLSAQSFTFPMHVEQVFFVEFINKLEGGVVSRAKRAKVKI